MKNTISIIAVNYHANDFRDMLIDSIEKNKSKEADIEIIIIDNSVNNRGHWAGLEAGINQAQGNYIMVLDIDSHILMKDFDIKVLEYFKNNKFNLLFGEGGLMKPARPCVGFFRKKWFLDNKMSFKPVQFECLKFDVGVYMYHKAVHTGSKVGFFPYQKSTYKSVWGNNFSLNGEPFIYHHWYGTRFWPVTRLEVDGRSREQFLKTKASLFAQYYKNNTAILDQFNLNV